MLSLKKSKNKNITVVNSSYQVHKWISVPVHGSEVVIDLAKWQLRISAVR